MTQIMTQIIQFLVETKKIIGNQKISFELSGTHSQNECIIHSGQYKLAKIYALRILVSVLTKLIYIYSLYIETSFVR